MANAEVQRLEQRVQALEAALSVAVQSRRLRVRFPVANTRRDITHGLVQIPDGYRIEWATANIVATAGVLWTPDLAFLQADAANAEAIITFYVSSQEAINAF